MLKTIGFTYLFLSVAAFGQVTGALSGAIGDQSDSPLPNATVKLFVAGGKQPITIGKTNEAGRFIFSGLNPATYDVAVEAPGFASYTYRQAQVVPGRELALPSIQLKLGTVTETIEVTAELEGVQTQNATISTTITSLQITNLPVIGRQVSRLFITQPGVSSAGGTTQSVNGLKASTTNLTLDGINIQDNFSRTNALDYAPFRTTIDQVDVITIDTSNSTAQFGGGASEIRMVTKSGTNQYKGTVYWYNRNDALSANDWFNNQSGVAKSKLNLNQPGFSLGGPVALSKNKIFRDKLFFFTNYEWYRNKNQSSQTRTVLSPDAANGIFTYNDTSGVRRTADLRALRGYTPDPTIAALIKQLPAGNAPGGDGLNTLGYRFNAAANEFRNQFVYKTDYYINSNNVITGSYNYINNPTQRPDVTSTFYTTQPKVNNTLKNHLLSLQWRWSVSPTLTNELRGGFALTHTTFDVNEPYTKSVLTNLSFTNPSNTFLNQGRDTNTYPIQDNATWIKGKHQVSFGYQYQKITSTIFNDGGIVPSYAIGLSTANTTGLAAADLPGVRTSDLAIANLLYPTLAGIVSTATQTFNVNSQTSGFVPGATSRRQLFWSTHSLYAQDNIKLTRSLTLNIGVRYEYWRPLDEKNGLFLSPVLQNNDLKATILNPNTVLDFIGGASGRSFYKSDKNNFAPNLGFAWAPGSGKTAIRGGYSISFVNDNVVTTIRNNVNTASGLSSVATLTGITATLPNAPTIASPTYKVPRTLADNYALSATSAIGLPDPNLATPMIHQWNLSVEHEIKGFFLTARYLGNQSSNLLRGYDYNQVLYNANGFLADFKRAQTNGDLALTSTGTYNPSYNPNIGGSQPLTVFSQLASPLLTNATIVNLIRTGQVGSLADTYMTNRLNGPVNFYSNPNIQGGNAINNGGMSNFHSLQLQATKRTRAGLQFQISYALAKALSNVSGELQTNFEPLLDNANPNLERQRSPFDIRHVLKSNFVYELPFGPGKRWASGNSLLKHVVGGWSVSGIWNYQTGSPYSILSGYGTLNRAARSTATNTASIAGMTMDQLAPLTSGVYRTGSNIYFLSPSLLNPNGDGRGTAQAGSTAFAGQVFFNPDAGTLGNLQRRAFTGPHDFSWDTSVAKTFRINDRQRFDLHFDFFNTFNHPTFTMRPSSAGDFGTTARYTITGTTFGQLNEMNHDPRQIQIAARYSF
ncbi:MAG: carboxypeptidase regulatory-like domain-containing protein [Bryobacteraceae bacterium]